MQLKSAQDIKRIYHSGQITGGFLREVASLVKPDTTTKELDVFAAEYFSKHKSAPAFLGYKGFPANICVSIDDEIVHGIPGERRLKPGEIISIDVGTILDGYYSDAASTYVVGDKVPSADAERLMAGTQASLKAGIQALAPGQPIRQVSRAIENELLRHSLGVIRELTGHGVGFKLHEEPTVYNFDTGARGELVKEGLVVAIEPMASLGSTQILLAADNWTYRTADGSLAAHYEHTVACWNGHVYVLTDPLDDEARQEFGTSN